MTQQLAFLPDEPRLSGTGSVFPIAVPEPERSFDGDPNDFRIDAHTREIGRIGIAAAREALAEAVRRATAREQKVAA